MANFGLKKLRLVNPRDGWPNEKAVAAAAGADEVVNSAKVFHTINEAIGDLHTLYATTARSRDLAKDIVTPAQAIRQIRVLISEGENVGVLFGCERSGLDNDEIALADSIIMAPVDPAFASLNLAQAVLLLGYEWMKMTEEATLGRKTEFDGPGNEGFNLRGSRPATKEELLSLFKHLEEELDESGFLRPQEKRPVMIRNIRTMFQRMRATEQEVRTLRGIVASLTRVRKRRQKVP